MQIIKHAATLAALCASFMVSPTMAADYEVDVFAQGSPFRGVQGLAFGPDGALYASSISGQSIYKVNIDDGSFETIVPSPLGNADDLAIGQDGSIVWTDIGAGSVRVRRPNGVIEDLSEGLIGVNGINFGPDGRLFVSHLLPPSKLYEIDLRGGRAPIFVMEVPGFLNGFEIDDDYNLFGPLSGKNSVVRIDVKNKQQHVVSKGLVTPISVNLSPEKDIVLLSYSTGDVLRIDPESGESSVIASLEPPIDNHAVAKNGMIYVSRPSAGQIVEVDPKTGGTRIVVNGEFQGPGGLMLLERDGRKKLLVADLLGHGNVDIDTGDVEPVNDLATTLFRALREYAGGTSIAASDDILYSADARTNGVFVINLSTGKALHAFKDILSPYDMAVMDDGGIAIAEYGGGRLLRLSEVKDGSHEVIARGLKGPVGVAKWDAEHLLVTETFNGAVSKVSLADGSVTRLVEGLSQPEGLAVTEDGLIVVAEVGAERLIQLDPETGTIESMVEELPIGASVWRVPAPVFLLTDVEIGEDGAIYMTSDRTNSVLKISPLN